MDWIAALIIAGSLVYGSAHGIPLHITPFVRHHPEQRYDCPPHIRAALAAHPPSHLDPALFCRRVDQ